MVTEEQVKRIEYKAGNKGGTIPVWICDCLDGCGAEIRVYPQWREKATGRCHKCSARASRTSEYTISESDVKRIEEVQTDTRTNKVWVLDCKGSCGTEIRVWPGQRSTATGLCRRCASRTRPFQHTFTFLKLHCKHRGLTCDLSYEDFLRFTEISECHYCSAAIPWEPWSSGKGYSKAYFLDRKDNGLGYSVQNCVVACTFCNMTRQDRFSYEEFKLLGPALRQIQEMRANTVTTE